MIFLSLFTVRFRKACCREECYREGYKPWHLFRNFGAYRGVLVRQRAFFGV